MMKISSKLFIIIGAVLLVIVLLFILRAQLFRSFIWHGIVQENSGESLKARVIFSGISGKVDNIVNVNKGHVKIEKEVAQVTSLDNPTAETALKNQPASFSEIKKDDQIEVESQKIFFFFKVDKKIIILSPDPIMGEVSEIDQTNKTIVVNQSSGTSQVKIPEKIKKMEVDLSNPKEPKRIYAEAQISDLKTKMSIALIFGRGYELGDVLDPEAIVILSAGRNK